MNTTSNSDIMRKCWNFLMQPLVFPSRQTDLAGAAAHGMQVQFFFHEPRRSAWMNPVAYTYYHSTYEYMGSPQQSSKLAANSSNSCSSLPYAAHSAWRDIGGVFVGHPRRRRSKTMKATQAHGYYIMAANWPWYLISPHGPLSSCSCCAAPLQAPSRG